MDTTTALAGFSALSQPTRLAVFRLLLQTGPAGLAAGDIAATLDVRQNTLSANLSILQGAGLIRSAREGRSIRYFADIPGTQALIGFLIQDCCGGNPALCEPILTSLTCATEACS